MAGSGGGGDRETQLAANVCGVLCPCGPNGELLGCGHKPKHKGPHSWASLPTFVKPTDNMPLEIGPPGHKPVTGTLAHEGLTVIASREWWQAVCSSLGDDFPHVQSIRMAMEADRA